MNIPIKLYFEGCTDNSIAPDVYFFDRSAGVISPRNNFVVSRRADRNVLSYYHDDIWDFSTYDMLSAKNRIRFGHVKTVGLRIEAKRIMFLLLIFGKGKGGAVLSPSTLYRYFQGILVRVCEYAQRKSMTLKEFFESSKALEEYAKNLMEKHLDRIPWFVSLLRFLTNLDNHNTGINIEWPRILISRLNNWYQSNYNIEQTPIVPADIFAEAATQRWTHFYKAYDKSENLTRLIGRIASNPLYARSASRGVTPLGNRFTQKTEGYVSWDKAIMECGLSDLFSEYDVNDCQEFQTYLVSLFYTCKHLIMSYSGMRDDETKLLQHGSMDESRNGKTTQIIGLTKKVHGVPTEHKWVTIPKIKKVVTFLENIGDTILSKRLIEAKEKPLFISIKLLRDSRIEGKKNFGDLASQYSEHHRELQLEGESLLVQEKHIKELEDVSLGRDWRNDKKIRIGKPWPFRYHQYRRSLAVYALNSGVVSIEALKHQFGHLFQEMTSYYGRGAGSAKSLIGTEDSEHLKSEIGRLRPVFDFLSYTKNVLFSDEPLYGAHGIYVQKHEMGIKDYILENREDTIRKFEKGMLHYEETALGGCTSTAPCDSHLSGSFTECFGCDGAEIKKSKVIDAIREQKDFVMQLDKGTLEHRTETRDLEFLERQLEIIERKEYGNS